jgi:hypothetical protein
MTGHTFISYSKKDSSFVFNLADNLADSGLKVWIDRSLGAGEDWLENIENNIKAAGNVVVVVSKNSMASDWVLHEGSLADGWRKHIIPVLIEKVETLPAWVERHQLIDFANKPYEVAYKELVEALEPQTRSFQDPMDYSYGVEAGKPEETGDEAAHEESPGAPEPAFRESERSKNGGDEGEEVNFSAFYPKEVTVEKWYTLLVYAYVPQELETVHKDARKFEDEIGEISESKPATTTRLARGAEVTVVPSCEGVTFNPERVTFKWAEDRHRVQFRLQAEASLAGLAANATVTLYVGPLIVGTLKMGMLFQETEAEPGSLENEETQGRMYHQDDIFISYSHRDTEVVRRCKEAYEALGHNVLIDFETLRAGQEWNAELMRMIERSNIFQLFWSKNSSASKYCRQEWLYALGLKRGEGFIRPVYWEEPLPAPPDELSALHFDYAPFAVKH